jgi:hypothetical protein
MKPNIRDKHHCLVTNPPQQEYPKEKILYSVINKANLGQGFYSGFIFIRIKFLHNQFGSIIKFNIVHSPIVVVL